jgi:hypothetical protein
MHLNGKEELLWKMGVSLEMRHRNWREDNVKRKVYKNRVWKSPTQIVRLAKLFTYWVEELER